MVHAISVKDLTKNFGKVKAVDGISFNVPKGEIFGFLGPNGAGKTTTIRCMMDFLRPTSGSIQVLGKDAQKDETILKNRIGYLSGNVSMYLNWTGKMHIDFFRKLNRRTDIADELIRRFDFDVTRKAGKYSSGNRQKLGLILALMSKPDLVILDEPTNALDPLLQNELYEVLREFTQEGSTVFMSSHNLSEVERVCHRVGIIKKGKMVATENITVLKRKKIYTVKAMFAENFNTEKFSIKGVEIEEVRKDMVSLKVKGDVNELIQYLGKHKLRDLEIDHASLEDIFLEFYENE